MLNNKSVETTFKKLLGDGRAWRTPHGFTNDFLEILVSPFSELKEWFSNIKYCHFPSFFQDENNIFNNEELFGIKYKKDSLTERAKDIDSSWRMLYGNSHYKTLEEQLRRKGFELYILENTSNETPELGTGFSYGNATYKGKLDDIPAQYGGHSSRIVGNGFLNIEGSIKDPAQFRNGKNSFYIKGFFDPSDEEWDSIIDIVLRLKQAHEVAVCLIAERKVADNDYYNVQSFADSIDGGSPETTEFMEKLNRYSSI